jgi:hypothetical protein
MPWDRDETGPPARVSVERRCMITRENGLPLAARDYRV